MDTRRDPRSGEASTPTPEISDTGLVKLIDLQPVGGQGWRSRPIALLVLAVAAVLAVAGLATALRAPGPTPTAPVVANASPSPARPTIGPASPAAPTRTPTPAPTLLPTSTPIPAWAWRREDLFPNVDFEPQGIWSANERLLVVGQQPALNSARPSWAIARSAPGQGWDIVAAPPAIDELMAGALFDDELWFVARVGGVTEASTTWQLVGTKTGDAWDSAGSSDLGPLDGAMFVGRVAGQWVVASWQYRADAGEGASRSAMQWSSDGRTWHAAILPALDGDPSFTRSAMLGDTMVVLGASDHDGQEHPFVLSSRDGKTWKKSPIVVPASSTPTGLACSSLACVVVVAQENGNGAALIALQTGDLVTWSRTEISAPVTETGGYLTDLTATDAGFVALGGGTGYAFVTEDGVAWQSLQVIVAPTGIDSLRGIAVTGHDVVALERGADNGSSGVWRGTLPTGGS